MSHLQVPDSLEKMQKWRAEAPLLTQAEAYKHGQMMHTIADIAYLIECSESHLSDFFAKNPKTNAAFKRGRAERVASLRRKQFSQAMDEGNTQMLIHLGKTYIEEQRPEKANVNVNVDMNQLLDQLRGVEKKPMIDITPSHAIEHTEE